MNKQWRLMFAWPNLTLIEIDGPTAVTVIPDNAVLAMLCNLQSGDTLTYEAVNTQ